MSSVPSLVAEQAKASSTSTSSKTPRFSQLAELVVVAVPFFALRAPSSFSKASNRFPKRLQAYSRMPSAHSCLSATRCIALPWHELVECNMIICAPWIMFKTLEFLDKSCNMLKILKIIKFFFTSLLRTVRPIVLTPGPASLCDNIRRRQTPDLRAMRAAYSRRTPQRR